MSGQINHQKQAAVLDLLNKGRKNRFLSLVPMPALPVVPRKKQGWSVAALLLALVVTLGNALAVAGTAFFTVSQVLYQGLAVISGTGTLGAMLCLYGSSVFPAFQSFLTTKEEQDEFTGLAHDLALAERLGLRTDSPELHNFLKRGIDKRRDTRCRVALRVYFEQKFVGLPDDGKALLTDEGHMGGGSGSSDTKGFDSESIKKFIFEKVSAEDERFADLLHGYFSEGDGELKGLAGPAGTFFKAIYGVKTESTHPSAGDAPENKLENSLIFDEELALLEQLEQLKQGGPVDLDTAFFEIATFHQWVRTRLRNGKPITVVPALDGLGDTRAKDSKDKESDFKKELEYYELGPSAQTRVAALKRSLFPTLTELSKTNFYDQYLKASLGQTRELVNRTINEEENFSASLTGHMDSHQNFAETGVPLPTREEAKKALRQHWAHSERESDNIAISGKWESRFGLLGWWIGLFGATANAILGYLGLTSLLGLLGLVAFPSIFWPVLIIGMVAAFGSSFWMTRLSIVARFQELGRWFDKDLYVEHRWLRYFAMFIALGGGSAAGYLAFIAGQAFVLACLGFLGANPITIAVVGFIFGFFCAFFTFCGAGALMVDHLYKRLEPYVDMAQDESLGTPFTRVCKIVRLFFVGHLGEVDELRAFQFVLGRTLGLMLLAGAIASQISFGLAPLVLIGTVFAAIGMFAMYSDVFDLAQELVDFVFKGLRWLIEPIRPKHLPIIGLSLAGAGLLELLVTSAMSCAIHATVAGIGVSMAPTLFAVSLLALIAVMVLWAAQYRSLSACRGLTNLGDEGFFNRKDKPMLSGPDVLMPSATATATATPKAEAEAGCLSLICSCFYSRGSSRE